MNQTIRVKSSVNANDDNQNEADEGGQSIAVIVSLIVLGLVGAIATWFVYKRTNLCRTQKPDHDPEPGKNENETLMPQLENGKHNPAS